jgi:hypothetical protein
VGITFNRDDGMGGPAAALFDHRMIAGTARGDLLDRLLLDRYRGLAADAKTALRLKAMIGSDTNKSLFVARMAATGTRVEEKILALHRRRRDLVADLLEGSEMSGRFSDDDLLDLIRS